MLPTRHAPRETAFFGLVLALALALVPVLPALPASAVDLQAAWDDLEMLKKSTKSRARNDDLFQYLDAVFNAFKDPDMPEEPAEDAPEEDRKAYESAKAKADKDVEKFRDSAEKLILKIMTITKVKNETNLRDDVNTKAATILGEMAPYLDEDGRKDLSKKIMKAIEKDLTKVKTHDVSTDHLDACFGALGKLNDPNSLRWMAKNYTHAIDIRKEYLIAAHKAMVLFKEVPPKVRLEVCQAMVKTYAGVESQAEQVSNDPKITAKKDFWDAIKTYTIPVLQKMAGRPEDKEGVPMAKVAQFQEYMRDHRNAKKSPWIDPMPEDPKK